MKRLSIQITVCLAFLVTNLYVNAANTGVNPILGDLSYYSTYPGSPYHASESLRITTHLRYVEHLLRAADTDHLTRRQKKRRAAALDLLHEYWVNGSFPNNYDYPGERKACFRDKDGNICAVGYLVQQTGREDLVEEVEQEMNYFLIAEMESEELEKWAKKNGLSLVECAMIQPTYWGWPSPNNDYISSGHAFLSGTFTGLNASSIVLNSIQLRNNQYGLALPITGITTRSWTNPCRFLVL